MVFPVVVYGCESWTVKKAECWRIDAFDLWCWRRLLRVPWTARRSNKSFLKEISPGCPLEGLMLKLKLQCFDHLMWRADSLQKTLMLRGIGGRRRRGRQRMRWTNLGSILNSILDSKVISNKGPSHQGYGFSSNHVWMWELDCEESWVLKNWCFWSVVLKNTLENLLYYKEIQPIHPKD